jgi:hypothetical protein
MKLSSPSLYYPESLLMMLCALVSFITDNDSGRAIDVEAEIKDAD